MSDFKILLINSKLYCKVEINIKPNVYFKRKCSLPLNSKNLISYPQNNLNMKTKKYKSEVEFLERESPRITRTRVYMRRMHTGRWCASAVVCREPKGNAHTGTGVCIDVCILNLL